MSVWKHGLELHIRPDGFSRHSQNFPFKGSRVCIILKGTWNIFHEKNYMLGHKASLNTFKKTKLHQAWDSCSSRKEQEQVTGALAPLEGGWGGSLNKVMVGVDPWVPLEAWLRWLPTCLVVLCVGVIAQYPLFLLPAPLKWQLVCGVSVSCCS